MKDVNCGYCMRGELLEKFGKALIELCHRHCDPFLPNSELTVLLITENGKIYS